MIYFDLSRLKILIFVRILRFEFSKVQDFENFELSSMLLEGIVFQTTLTMIGLLLRAVRPDLRTHHTI